MSVVLIGDPGGAIEPMTIPVGDFWIPAKPMPQPRIKARAVGTPAIQRVLRGLRDHVRSGHYSEGTICAAVQRALDIKDFIQIYTPDNKAKEHTGWRKEIWRAAQMILPPEEIDEPVVLTVTFYVKRPQSMMGKRYFDGPIPHPSRGDLSNFVKAVEDALNPIPASKTSHGRRGFWKDDARVFAGHNAKYYTAKDKPAGAYVLIETIDPESQVTQPPDAV